MTPFVMLIVLAAALILLGGGVALLGGNRSPVERRIEQFVGPGASSKLITAVSEDDVVVARASMADKIDARLSDRTFYGRIRARIVRADAKLRVSEYILLVLAAGLLVAAATYWIFDGNWLLTVLGFGVGTLIPRIYLNTVANRRIRAFNSQLSDTINLWVNALRSGYSVLQSMETIAAEMPPPVSQEFGRVVQEVRLGLSLKEALENMVRRVPSEDLDLVVTAVNIQREVGGSLADVLDNISFTIRERVRIKGEIRTLTAQGRLSGWIIGSLPLVLTLIIYAINPGYISRLWANEAPFVPGTQIPVGWIAIGISAIMVLIGVWFIRRIVDIEV